MADQARSSITVDADKSAVMAVIADFEAYPQWASMIKSVTVEETGADGRGSQVTFTMDAGMLSDTYTLAYDWQGDDRVDWHLVKSKTMKSQQGAYILDDAGGSTNALSKSSDTSAAGSRFGRATAVPGATIPATAREIIATTTRARRLFMVPPTRFTTHLPR